MSGSHLSREFFDLVKSIGECRSKQEEDKIIESEMGQLKVKFSDVANFQNPKKLKELLIRSIYVEMLGHDASTFAYIHGVNLCHNKSLLAKRVGYLVSCLFLDPKNSELMILLINTIQKDLKSSNLLEVSFALIVISRLANVEMVPVLGSLITPLLGHAADMIRRRAVIAFHRLVQVGGDLAPQQIHQVVRRSLCDPDPGVMAVGLNLLQDLANSDDPSPCIDLIPSVVGILKQVIDQRLPKEFEYHRMPAPWIQLRLIAIISVLANKARGIEYPEVVGVVQETMRRADLGSNAGAAVAFECVKCAAAIVPNKTLLEHASLVVARFMASESHNYKYMGVTCLSQLVSYANEHQMLVVECLEDSDDTLRRRTIELLTQMTNVNNVTVVVERMLSQLSDGGDDLHFKRDLSCRICSLCEGFAPSNEWYLKTINQVLSRVPDKTVPASVTENLTRLVAEQEGPDEVTGVDLRVSAANEYIGYLESFLEKKSSFSSQFLSLIVWMVGEFSTMTSLDSYASVDDVVDLLIQAAEEAVGLDQAPFISAIAKLAIVSGSEITKSSASHLFNRFLKAKQPSKISFEVERRCRDYLFVLNQPVSVQKAVLPLDASCEDISIDLGFLDGFLTEARKRGAREYSRPIRKQSAAIVPQPLSSAPALSGLKFDAYAAPKMPSGVVTPVTVGSPPPAVAVSPVAGGPPKLNTGTGSKRWGLQPTVQPETVQAPQPTVHVKQPVAVVASQPPAAATLSREYLEKQRMAAALFSGASVASSSKKSAPVPQVKPDTSDLLDFGSEGPVFTSNVATKTTSSDDLLDL